MMHFIKQSVCLFPGLILAVSSLNAQQAVNPVTVSPANTFVFEENKTQWPSQVRFMADAGGGVRLFLENGVFTYVKYDEKALAEQHDEQHEGGGPHKQADEKINLHAFKVHFVNADFSAPAQGLNKQEAYRNYFIGSDPSKWSSNVSLYSEVLYNNIYKGIDLHAYGQQGNFKYDFIVSAGADASQAVLLFEGINGLKVVDNRLYIPTTAGDLVEEKPYSYQEIGGQKVEVECRYKLASDGVTVTFEFPRGYNKNYPLVIDPTLVGATYSGAPSSTVTFGHSATYDQAGNIYGGGECFNTGYPTTPGAFQSVFAGGTIDIVVSKFNPNGSALIWATYVGGYGKDYPTSLIVNASGQLYILGCTASPNYPTSAGCYDNSFNGGFYDIALTALNSTGTALVGSTYLGGAFNDGGGGAIYFMNSHDAMRGEIILDAAGNPWVTSYTNSPNFPTTVGAYDGTLNGSYDGCVFRMSPNLSVLQWSTYLGGSADEAGYGIRVNNAGEAYVCGPTASSNFPTTPGAYQTSYQGSACDAFMVHFNSAGNALVAGSYFGTAQNDVNYFLDLDGSGTPYFYGTTGGNTPIFNAPYSNPNSGNFIYKINPGLSSLVYSTQFGSGVLSSHLEPEAFMVDTCGGIYVSGFNSTAAYPVTSNALFTSPPALGNSSCYFIVLKKDVTQLLYGSFYYGWHVDGGTSRFDPNGTIYQGICIGSGNAITPSWAYDNGANPSNWDLFVVKIAMDLTGVVALASPLPNDTICPGNISFVNSSSGINYIWDFGDGSPTDTATTPPPHPYTTPGTYTVTLIAIDSTSCIMIDTAQLLITVLPSPIVNLGPDTVICGSGTIILDAQNPGNTYLWSTGATTQTISVNTVGTYWVTVGGGTCTDSDTIAISYGQGGPVAQASILPNDTICPGNISFTNSSTGIDYIWDFGDGSPTDTSTTPPAHPYTTAGTYTVTLIAIDSTACTYISDTTQIVITVLPSPIVNLGPDTVICGSGTITLDAQNPGNTYLWSTGATTQTISVNTVGTYWVTVGAGTCTGSDTIAISYGQGGPVAQASILPNDTICPGNISFTNSSTGIDYIWDFGDGSPTDTSTTPPAHPYTTAGTYTVTLIAIDSSACTYISDTTQIVITVLAVPVVNLGPDSAFCNFSSFTLNAQNPGCSYIWSTGSTSPSITVNAVGTYWVIASNGVCFDSDSIVLSTATISTNLADTTLCAGQSLTLDAQNPGSTYTWSTGASTQTISVTASGQYWVTVVNGSCVTSDTVQISFISYPVLPPFSDTVLCPNETLTLDAGNPTSSILWSTGATTQTIDASASGTYWVIVSNGSCAISDTMQVTRVSPISMADSITLCDDNALLLDAGIANATSYLWSTGATSPSISAFESGYYWVEVNNNGCVMRDSTYLDGHLGGGMVYVPNTFTPNGNGLNEYFTAVGLEMYDFHMMIFNRWGQLIYETDSPSPGWDGKYKGVLVQEDVYVWKIEYRTYCTGDKLKRRIGHVMVLK